MTQRSSSCATMFSTRRSGVAHEISSTDSRCAYVSKRSGSGAPFWEPPSPPHMCRLMNSMLMFQKNSPCWNDVQHSPLRRGSWNRLELDELKRSGSGTLFESHLSQLVSFNELCVHVPKEFSMWNIIQHSQLRRGLSMKLAGLWMSWKDSRPVSSFGLTLIVARNHNCKKVEMR